MIEEITELKCNCCGKTFYTEYGSLGSINHENYTSDWNMNVMINKFTNADDKGRYEIFLDSITLDGNLCNIKNNSYDVGIEIFECRLKWLNSNGYNDIVEYLDKNKCNIKKEFDNVIKAII